MSRSAHRELTEDQARTVAETSRLLRDELAVRKRLIGLACLPSDIEHNRTVADHHAASNALRMYAAGVWAFSEDALRERAVHVIAWGVS